MESLLYKIHKNIYTNSCMTQEVLVCNMLKFCGFQLCMPPSRTFHVDVFLTDCWRAGLDSQSRTDRRSSGNLGIFEAKSVRSEASLTGSSPHRR